MAESLRVKEGWAEYTARFRVTGQNCEAGNNRLVIQAGKISGKLWIANLLLAPAP